jgi:hypothetical protein
VHAFRTMAYLDVNKTGSTFVSAFLRAHLDDEEVSFVKHGRIELRPPRGRLHLISVRDPVEQYLSLFSYGCDRKGDIHNRLLAHGWGDLYRRDQESFERWLDRVLDPANAWLLAREYRLSGCARHVGLMSYRVARLAIPGSVVRLRAVRAPGDIVSVYRRHSVVDAVVHTETLAADLDSFVSATAGQLPWKPSAEQARAALGTSARVNASRRVDDHGISVSSSAREAIRAREVLLVEEFGYEG